MAPTKVKTITSHAGLSRWYGEVTPYGWIPRTNIRTPYASSPTHDVYLYRNEPVIVCETSHKRYEIYALDESETIYHTDEEATEAFIHMRHAQTA